MQYSCNRVDDKANSIEISQICSSISAFNIRNTSWRLHVYNLQMCWLDKSSIFSLVSFFSFSRVLSIIKDRMNILYPFHNFSLSKRNNTYGWQGNLLFVLQLLVQDHERKPHIWFSYAYSLSQILLLALRLNCPM